MRMLRDHLVPQPLGIGFGHLLDGALSLT